MAVPSDPAQTSPGNDGRVAWSVAALVAATVLLGGLLPDRAVRVAASPADDPACAEWGDGCRVCRRLAEGAACSLPGIACTPGALQCLHRAGG